MIQLETVQQIAPERVLALWCRGVGRGLAARGAVQRFWFPTLKIRLDKLLVERGVAGSRERAQALILAGKVLVNEQKMEKAGAQV